MGSKTLSSISFKLNTLGIEIPRRTWTVSRAPRKRRTFPPDGCVFKNSRGWVAAPGRPQFWRAKALGGGRQGRNVYAPSVVRGPPSGPRARSALAVWQFPASTNPIPLSGLSLYLYSQIGKILHPQFTFCATDLCH